MQKRKIHEKQEEELIRSLETEHDLFYYRMVSEPSRSVYDQCNIIRFYECVYEYFMYCENIAPDIINACIGNNRLLDVLHALYLKREDLRVDSWEDIEELLFAFAEEEKAGSDEDAPSIEENAKSILSELHNAGGCGAAEDYAKGWDEAMAEAIRIVEGITGICVEESLDGTGSNC